MSRNLGAGNASALLAKVSSQLKRGHGQPAVKENDDDDEGVGVS